MRPEKDEYDDEGQENKTKSIWSQAKLSFQNGGRPKAFDTPNDLWQAACKYFEWVDANPWYKTDYKGKDAIRVDIPTQRPYLLKAFCVFSSIGTSTFNDYEKKEDKGDFSEVATRIKDIIYSQKFEGATVGDFQHNIIAMDLGLTAKQDLTTDGKEIPQNVVIFNGKEFKI